jgi:Sap, sulfolipid-1-addressing protein
MLLLDRPKRLLLGYWLGAMTTGVSVGLAIVYWLHDSNVVSTTKHSVNPALNIVLGLIALLVAVVIGTGRFAGEESRHRRHGDEPKKQPRWQRTLSKGSARMTFLVGLLLSFPGASYLASLTEIDKQNLGVTATVATVLAVNLVMLVLLEAPLIGYVIAPESTPIAVERFKSWFSANARRAITVAAVVIGLALIVRGLVNI